MDIDANIVEIYYVDDFVKEYSKTIKNTCIGSNDVKKHRNKPFYPHKNNKDLASYQKKTRQILKREILSQRSSTPMLV